VGFQASSFGLTLVPDVALLTTGVMVATDGVGLGSLGPPAEVANGVTGLVIGLFGCAGWQSHEELTAVADGLMSLLESSVVLLCCAGWQSHDEVLAVANGVTVLLVGVDVAVC
jgi:hypothetical protein